jgi:hypothetical protein
VDAVIGDSRGELAPSTMDSLDYPNSSTTAISWTFSQRHRKTALQYGCISKLAQRMSTAAVL